MRDIVLPARPIHGVPSRNHAVDFGERTRLACCRRRLAVGIVTTIRLHNFARRNGKATFAVRRLKPRAGGICSPFSTASFLSLTIFLLAFLTAFGADTNSPPASLAIRLKNARAEKKVDDRLNALASLAKTLPLSEIPAALKAADGLEQLRERVVFTESVLQHWGELAPADAFARIAEMPEGMPKVETIRVVTPLFAKKDIRAAAAAVLKMNPGRSRNEATTLLAENWTRSDAQAAINWVNNLPEGFPKEAAMHDIYFIWVHSDPAGASLTVQNLPSGDTKNALIMNVAGDWAAQNPSDAIHWADTLPMETDKALAQVTITESWADSDPSAAAAYAMKLSPPDLKDRAILAVLERWATQDPQQALSWILKTLGDDLQAGGIARVMNIYVPAAPEAASRWVDQLSAGPVRESAIGSYVETVRLWNPAAGARLGWKTADPAERERRVEPCFILWLAWDPVSAKQWLKGTNLPDAVQNRWLAEKPEDLP